MIEYLKILAEPLAAFFFGRRVVRFTVHRAFFLQSRRECYFLNVTNLSGKREIEVTHVWFEWPPQVHATEPSRPLPKRLKPDETWETWIDVGRVQVKGRAQVFSSARLRLSTGGVVKSKENRNVPDQGFVPGGSVP